jgi:hypothetical protein
VTRDYEEENNYFDNSHGLFLYLVEQYMDKVLQKLAKINWAPIDFTTRNQGFSPLSALSGHDSSKSKLSIMTFSLNSFFKHRFGY